MSLRVALWMRFSFFSCRRNATCKDSSKSEDVGLPKLSRRVFCDVDHLRFCFHPWRLGNRLVDWRVYFFKRFALLFEQREFRAQLALADVFEKSAGNEIERADRAQRQRDEQEGQQHSEAGLICFALELPKRDRAVDDQEDDQVESRYHHQRDAGHHPLFAPPL